MHKNDLALNNQQWLICHKNQPNQTLTHPFWMQCDVSHFLPGISENISSVP